MAPPGKRRLWLLLSLALCAAVAAVAGALWAGRTAAAPVCFVVLSHEQPGQQARHSWSQGPTLEGEAERQLVADLSASGLGALTSLDDKILRQVFSGTGVLPDPARLGIYTEAGLALLGTLRCVERDPAEPSVDHVVRVSLEVQAFDTSSGDLMVRNLTEAVAAAKSVPDACASAELQAARAMGPLVARDLEARLGM